MKSMLWKDFYNIGHNWKQLVYMVVILGIGMIPAGGIESFAVSFIMICSMMTITTFSFDEKCKWEKYALIMPLTRKTYVMEKYVFHLLFALVSAGIAVGAGSLFYLATSKGDLTVLFISGATGIGISVLLGSIFIPFVIRFGAESTRMIILGGVGIPALLAFAAYKIGSRYPEFFTGNRIRLMVIAIGVAIVAWLITSCFLSIRWFQKKEF